MKAPNPKKSLRGHIIFLGALIVVLVGGVGGWAMTAELSNAVIGEGTIIVDDNVKKIQHLTGGIVKKIYVSEGMHVKAGQVLMALEDTTVKAELGILNGTLAQYYTRKSRLEAEQLGAATFTPVNLTDKQIDPIAAAGLVQGEEKLFDTRRSSLEGMKKQLVERKAQSQEEISGETLQLQSLSQQIVLVKQEADVTKQLYDKQLVTLQRYNELKRQQAGLEGEVGERTSARAQAEGKISELSLQILQLDEDRRAENSKDIADAESKIAEAEQRRTASLDQLNRLDIKAQMDGRIYQLDVHTVGGVINAGEQLMLLVPDQRLLTVEVKIATNHIDQVRVGQRVNLRFTAFDQRITPGVEGDVVSVAPDVVTDQRTGASYYPVRVKPDRTSLDAASNVSLYPGMPAEAFIRIADRSVISYMMKPLADQMRHTFREE